MSMTRRSLFGLGAGAAAASVVTVPAVVHDGNFAEIMATRFPPEFMANVNGAATMRVILYRMARALNDAGID